MVEAPGEAQFRALVTAEDRLRMLQGAVNAATAAIVATLAMVLADGLWAGPGWRSFEHWISWTCGVAPARAHRWGLLARRWAELPLTMAAFTEGRLTEDQAFTVARLAPTDRDDQARDLALVCLVPQLERVLRSLPHPEPPPPAEMRRDVRVGHRDGGHWELHAHLPADEGALVEHALTTARDAVYRDRHPHTPDGTPDGTPTRSVSWADALIRTAELALDARDPATIAGRHPSARYQILVHLNSHGNGDRPGDARLHLGPVLPDGIRRYLTCDATMRAVYEHDGLALGLTITAPTVDHRLRAVVEHRDGGCRIPGCGQTRWLHIHHLVHREHGGPTAIANLVALCPHHHRQHHTGTLHIQGDPTTPNGLTVTDHHHRPIRYHPPPPGGTAPPSIPYQPPTCERLDTWSVLWN